MQFKNNISTTNIPTCPNVNIRYKLPPIVTSKIQHFDGIKIENLQQIELVAEAIKTDT